MLVDQARDAWLCRLVDRSRNNNLLYFRELKTGTLDFTKAQPKVMQQLLAGTAVRVDHLLPETANQRPSAKARQIYQRARINLEERGVATLFLALGLASWKVNDAGRPPAAPVLLLPVTLEIVSREGPIVTIERAGEAQLNNVLLDELATFYGCTIAPKDVLSDDIDDLAAIHAVYLRLRTLVRDVPEFAIDDRTILGNFSFLKLAIVQDLRACGDLLAAHDVIATLAGSKEARSALRRNRTDVDPRELDAIPPDNEYLVLDADSSQQRVITSVLRGQHGVIQGPPGTGKSQTIVNLITSLVADGKRVLFVAEKRAALEVVHRRLQQVNLGHLALDLHRADVARSAVIRRFAENLDLVRSTRTVDPTPVHVPFTDRRARLNRRVAKLHEPRDIFGLSAYTIQGRLLRLASAAHVATRSCCNTMARRATAPI